MDNDYTPPNVKCKELQDIIGHCQHMIKVIKDAEGTSKEKRIMEEFDAVDIHQILGQLVG